VNIGEEKDRSNAFYVFYDENKVPITGKTAHSGVNMEKNTIRMDFSVYNGLFGTAFDHTNMHNFVPHKITITQYENTDVNNENPLFEPVEVTIVGLFSGTYDMMVDQDLYELFKKDFVRPYFLYFDGTDGIGAVLDTAEKNNFQPHSYAVEGIHTMTKAVDVFIPIFELVAIFLCIGIVFILMNFSSKMINDKMHEIGILKALGAKNGSIGVIFGLQVALIAILTCILATAGYYFFIDLANDVLIESLMRLAPQSIVLDLDFLTFQSDIALTNCALIALLTVISLIVPFIKIRFIEPVKIIKSKE
jgi:ABC-type antimicrobial peptide transport system permease subunit